MTTVRHHFLILAYHVHSHTNPALELANRLLRLGAKVTFATTASACRRIISSTKCEGIDFLEFPDNFPKAFGEKGEEEEEKLEIRRACSDTLARAVSTSEVHGWPITCTVHTPTVPWVMGLVQELPGTSVLLWTQPAAVLVIFYRFFFGYDEAISGLFWDNRSSCEVELPGLPFSLKGRDIPTFLRPVNPHEWAIELFELQTKWLGEKGNRNVLVNTFESLELEALKAVEGLNLIPIGPLIPSDLILKKDHAKADYKKKGYIEWLDSKPNSSVVYVSFGSIWGLSSEQIEEIARALLEAGRPFLWIIRTPQEGNEDELKKQDVRQLTCLEELNQLGLIVPWCSQVEVLSHPSVGCFVTHCGWNSTLESIAAGVPVVGIPLWVEQVTNAKLVEEYWKIGVRANADENDLVERNEIKRCLELVMEDEEIRLNAEKWKELAVKAAAENGPADENLSHFVTSLGLAS